MLGQDSHWLYSSSSQGIGCAASSYGSDYMSLGADVAGSSYSLISSAHRLGGSSYLCSGAPGSYN